MYRTSPVSDRFILAGTDTLRNICASRKVVLATGIESNHYRQGLLSFVDKFYRTKFSLLTKWRK